VTGDPSATNSISGDIGFTAKLLGHGGSIVLMLVQLSASCRDGHLIAMPPRGDRLEAAMRVPTDGHLLCTIFAAPTA